MNRNHYEFVCVQYLCNNAAILCNATSLSSIVNTQTYPGSLPWHLFHKIM